MSYRLRKILAALIIIVTVFGWVVTVKGIDL